MKLVRFWKTDSRFPPEGFAQKIGNGHPARSEICDRQSSGTQQRCAISSAIALADCTWLLDIGDRRMRIGDVHQLGSTGHPGVRVRRHLRRGGIGAWMEHLSVDKEVCEFGRSFGEFRIRIECVWDA